MYVIVMSTWTKMIFDFRLLFADSYETRDRPSVLVTSPGSPDLLSNGQVSQKANRFTNRLTPAANTGGGPPGATQSPDQNVGGRIQIKLGYDPSGQQLVVTIIGSTNLTYRANGALRNPYVKVGSFACSSRLAIYRYIETLSGYQYI